jgi:hypothetical protein
MYGSVLATVLKLKRILNPVKVQSVVKQPCLGCDIQLETEILRWERGIPQTSWFVAKCNNCGTLSLISVGPDVKETRFGNYQCVDILRRDEYTYEQALVRLEQIQFFRR